MLVDLLSSTTYLGIGLDLLDGGIVELTGVSVPVADAVCVLNTGDVACV